MDYSFPLFAGLRPPSQSLVLLKKVDARLPGNGNSNSHGARPVHLIITMIQWIRNSRLSIKNSLSADLDIERQVAVPSALDVVVALIKPAPGNDRDPLLQSKRTEGFAADPVYGRAKCLPMLGEIKT